MPDAAGASCPRRIDRRYGMLIVMPLTPVAAMLMDCEPATGPSPVLALNGPFTTMLIATAPKPEANFSVKLPLASVVAAQGPEVRIKQ